MKLTTAMAFFMAITPATGMGSGPAQHVDVCMDTPSMSLVAEQAQILAAEMFSSIGVKIDWHNMRRCPANAIVISMSQDTPVSLRPTALAYALPYEGTHIVVFYDRITVRSGRRTTIALLAHVMVHEITHILEGVARHSETGIMKANWTTREIDGMSVTHMSFAPEDIEMIHAGLDRRAARVASLHPGELAQTTATVR